MGEEGGSSNAGWERGQGDANTQPFLQQHPGPGQGSAGDAERGGAEQGGSPFAQYCSWFWTLNKQHPKAFAKPAGGTPVLFGSGTTATLLNLPLLSTVN